MGVFTVDDVALVLEGGGMRASYSAAVIVKLLREQVKFPHVSGISAGSSHASNYLSNDPQRARACFVEFSGDPNFGSLWTFLTGRGLFNSEYIYQHTCGAGQSLPFDYPAFQANPAAFRIGATRTSDGSQRWFTRDDVGSMPELMTIVQASSTMPALMPPVTIDGVEYVDGAIGPNGGIPLDIARSDGFERFAVVMTRPRDYVKRPPRDIRALNRIFRRRPAVAEALAGRWRRYNATRQELFDLESDGRAILFFPETMPINNRERDVARLRRCYGLGMGQINREWPRWREFLGI
ncbi:patatin-like phospholipase family protein [Acidipropionibacterium thoenii]|uniref:patatin-like phospholipase family protein n=1 Tax=Acidipropionibacterium thoenii TaxID=1751 RepID=UPI000563AB94|nr:patatin family protein [Acidipropionibacterium thoenii]